MAVDDIAFAIEYDDLPAWIEDVRRITKLDLQDGGAAPERCARRGHCAETPLARRPLAVPRPPLHRRRSPLPPRGRGRRAVGVRARRGAGQAPGRGRGMHIHTPIAWPSSITPLPRCMTSGHYLIRWGRGSNDYAAPWGGLRLPVQVELSVLRNRQLPDIHAKYSWIQVRAQWCRLDAGVPPGGVLGGAGLCLGPRASSGPLCYSLCRQLPGSRTRSTDSWIQDRAYAPHPLAPGFPDAMQRLVAGKCKGRTHA